MERMNRLKEIYKTVDRGTAEEKIQNLPVFPRIVEFELTNHCNFQCLMCKTGVGTSTRERGYMTDEVFFSVIKEIRQTMTNVSGRGLIALKFVGQGEPLLHPKAIEYMKAAKENGILVHLTTNGSLLSESLKQRGSG